MYNKLFTKILDSSIWLAPDPHRLVWITLIAAMDEDGNAMFACADNLAARARVTVEQAESAIAAFEAPDPKSGDPEYEGRRIERFPGGWHILNAHKYRAMISKAIIREQTRLRTAKWRASKVTRGDAPVTQRDAKLKTGDAPVTPSEARAEAYTEKTPAASQPPLSNGKAVQRVFEHWRDVWKHPRAQLDEKRRKLIRAALKLYSEADLCQAITGYLNSPHHCGQNDRNTVFDSIELLLRDAKHIDAGLKFYSDPPSRHSKLTQRNIDNTSGWVPPEERHGNK